MEPIIISPPFGTFIRHEGTSSVLGSFTVDPRPGRALKIAQFIFDNLIWRVPGGWRNRIGLRNPGMMKIGEYTDRYALDEFVYSIVGLNMLDWEIFLAYFDERSLVGLQLELNMGCPNVDLHHDFAISADTLLAFCRRHNVIMKLPAEIPKALRLAEMGAQAGVKSFHCGNTFPSDIGGISGMPLKPINILTVEEIAKNFPGIPIIGGGGIYSFQDLIDYYNAGATRFSLATIWFRPWEAQRIIRQFYESELRDRLRTPLAFPNTPLVDGSVRQFT